MGDYIILKSPTIRQMIIHASRGNRPGPYTGGCYEYLTVHETDNTAPTATAAMHGEYLLSDEAANAPKSWGYTVDDKEIVQHLPDNEHGWHAGDGPYGPGNLTSLGIEICVNRGANLCQAYLNAAWLASRLLAARGLPLDRLRTHNWWSGKDCPHLLRANKSGPMGWEWFKGMVWLQMQSGGEVMQLRRQVDELKGRLNMTVELAKTA